MCCSPWGPKEWNMTEQLNNKMLHRCLRSNEDRVAGASFSPFLLPRSLSHTTVNVCYPLSLSSVLYGESGHLRLHQSHMIDVVFALQMRKWRKLSRCLRVQRNLSPTPAFSDHTVKCGKPRDKAPSDFEILWCTSFILWANIY